MSTNSALSQIQWVNHFEELGPAFYSRIQPTPLEGARLVQFNAELATRLGIDQGDPQQLVPGFNGEQPLGPAPALASLYAGHQFGVWVSQLGDGRAALLGQLQDAEGQLWEIQSKGCGPTPYSRHADGRAVLRSSIREYLCSEAMHGLGIPTTRALALLDSDTPVYREQIERGAILIRVAESHLRFGHFEVFAARSQLPQVRQLADYLIRHHHPDLLGRPEPYVALYRTVIARTAQLLAQWQAAGFCHGVMNTDNMSVLGLTLDYGPFGFLEAYDPGHICNHSDHLGRYAFNAQPHVAHWNLACLGQALLGLIEVEPAQAALDEFALLFAQRYRTLMAAKLGLPEDHPDFDQLLRRWQALLEQGQLDYSRSFRQLSEFAQGDLDAGRQLDQACENLADWPIWREDYRRALEADAAGQAQRLSAMAGANPVYILRNAFAQRAIEQAERGDYGEIGRLAELLRAPFERRPDAAAYELPGPPQYRDLAVSCSS